MIGSISFQTKARTIDHLGREQIADCPTAVSELWKNAYDAYARRVDLDLYGGKRPVAVLSDDGHGMNREEFVNRWLVVGTESKAGNDDTSAADRNGLRRRAKLGQKGIGRLSCANLGPTLLLISKRKDSDFVVSMVDWRLFENPYLNLSDIEVPVEVLKEKDKVLEHLPLLAARLLENLSGGEDRKRSARSKEAWERYDALKASDDGSHPSRELKEELEAIPFSENHLRNWPVWNGEAEHGTAMLVAGLNFDLQVLLDPSLNDTSAKAARNRFVETLSNFVDPFTDEGGSSVYATDPQFSYAVRAWNELVPRNIIGSDKDFGRDALEGLEHQIDGVFDDAGVFRGRIKTFGVWLEDERVIYPPRDLDLPSRSNTRVGPFGLYIAAMEFELRNTSMQAADFQHFRQLADKYAGFLMFRDGLRVLPYGRTDNDFFEIEERRSRHAGREFWNHRQMFGRVSISRRYNPNLKDKAGREGLLDNRAAKVLRELVSNVLMQAARLYFGTNSEFRKQALPAIREAFNARKAAEEREKLRKRNSRAFRSRLKDLSATLPLFKSEVEQFWDSLELKDPEDLDAVQERIDTYRSKLSDYSLSGAPKSLGTMASRYEAYRSDYRLTKGLIDGADEKLASARQVLAPPDPGSILEKQAKRNQRAYKLSLKGLRDRVQDMLQGQLAAAIELEKQKARTFDEETAAIIQRHRAGQITYADAARNLSDLRTSSEAGASEVFAPYLRALEILQENIDLEQLVSFGLEEANDLRGEIDRLTSLAQLGIAVEISGHELQDYDDLISDAFRKLPEEVRKLKAVRDISLGVEGLTDQLRFLSPLRLAGQKIRSKITGKDIASYLAEFFRLQLSTHSVELVTTKRFDRFSVTDFPSRLYPVFINLVNNAIYWTSNAKGHERTITLDIVDQEVIVSDTGPGVAPEDVGELFTLFFTRKSHGGRGVGLYLTRANLVSGGHKIRYVEDPRGMPHQGANFAIRFQGAEFG